VRSLIGFINQTKQQLNQLHHRTNGTIGHMWTTSLKGITFPITYSQQLIQQLQTPNNKSLHSQSEPQWPIPERARGGLRSFGGRPRTSAVGSRVESVRIVVIHTPPIRLQHPQHVELRLLRTHIHFADFFVLCWLKI
jgi:hypothetical protein